MLDAIGLELAYGATPALRGVSLSLAAGQRIALMGPSGCGKSSLLHCLCGVVRPDSGQVTLGDRVLTGLSDRERSRVRLEHFGVVFQFGDLVPELTLLENAALPLELLGESRRTAHQRARALLGELGVEDVAGSRAGEVSGGQAQRAAVARALVHEPQVVLADEPTGALDSTTAAAVLDALVALTTRIGAALLVVTHDNVVASHLDELVTMQDGSVLMPAAVDW
jgi:putative ABC transport system ATP-binding protein